MTQYIPWSMFSYTFAFSQCSQGFSEWNAVVYGITVSFLTVVFSVVVARVDVVDITVIRRSYLFPPLPFYPMNFPPYPRSRKYWGNLVLVVVLILELEGLYSFSIKSILCSIDSYLRKSSVLCRWDNSYNNSKAHRRYQNYPTFCSRILYATLLNAFAKSRKTTSACLPSFKVVTDGQWC